MGPVLSREGNRNALESTYKMMKKGDKLVAGTYISDEESPHFKLCISSPENVDANEGFIECYTRTEKSH